MFARSFRLQQILELGIPVLDVLLVRPEGNQEGNMIGAADPAGRNHLHTFAPCSGKAMIAIDHVETSRRDFRQQDRARQIRVTDGSRHQRDPQSPRIAPRIARGPPDRQFRALGARICGHVAQSREY